MTTSIDPRAWMIAHRGHASRYPENSLRAFDSAAQTGLTLIEFDIQFTADDVPVLLHDPTLLRTGGIRRPIRDVISTDLSCCPAGEPARFGERFSGETVRSLAEVMSYFAEHPALVPIVEIKGESAREVGIEKAVSLVLETLGEMLERCIVISFVLDVVRHARRLGAPKVGWCLSNYDEESYVKASGVGPELLLIDHRKLPPPPQGLWEGRWQWAVWEVVDPDVALSLRTRGIDLIETMACEEMLGSLQVDCA